jgi:hypothetical protein
MVEPSRSAPVKRLLNFVRTGLPFVSCREALAWLENLLQEVPAGQPRVVLPPAAVGIDETQFQKLRSGTLRRGLQIGYGHSYEALTLPYPPFGEILQALLTQPSLKIERALSTNLQDRVELHYWAGLAHRQYQEVEYCRTHDQEVIKTYRLAGNILGLAAVVVQTPQTYVNSCFRSSQHPGRLACPMSVQYRTSACLAMRPLLMVAGKFSSRKEELP